VKWKKNVFQLPSGRSGKYFTRELARLYGAYGEGTALECIALKAAAIFAPLMLQNPVGKSSYKENSGHLSRRLELWNQGNIRELVRGTDLSGQTQGRLERRRR
jgi:hypothetical protein